MWVQNYEGFVFHSIAAKKEIGLPIRNLSAWRAATRFLSLLHYLYVVTYGPLRADHLPGFFQELAPVSRPAIMSLFYKSATTAVPSACTTVSKAPSISRIWQRREQGRKCYSSCCPVHKSSPPRICHLPTPFATYAAPARKNKHGTALPYLLNPKSGAGKALFAYQAWTASCHAASLSSRTILKIAAAGTAKRRPRKPNRAPPARKANITTTGDMVTALPRTTGPTT